ncbi:MAG: ABC transporter permease [Candidatus Thorarchaeota archaeon]
MTQETNSQVDKEDSNSSELMSLSFSEFLLKLKGLFLNSFAKFVARKAIFYLVVVFFSVTLVFFIIESMPGDPVEVMLSSGNPPPGADLDALADIMREYFGLDRPVHERYISYLVNIFTGNLGQSFHFYPVFASNIIQYYLPYTLSLAIPVLFVSFFLGNWIGARAAYLKGKLNESSYFSLVFANQLPPFWFGLVIIFLYVLIFQTIPPIGAATQGTIPSLSISYFMDLVAHWILPFITLLVVYVGAWATGMR